MRDGHAWNQQCLRDIYCLGKAVDDLQVKALRWIQNSLENSHQKRFYRRLVISNI